MVILAAALCIGAVLVFARRDGEPLDADPDPLPPADPSWTDSKDAVTANNDLAFDLYAQLAREKSTRPLFFSPFSISNALVLSAEGARKQTADEIGKVLHLSKAARRTGADAGERPWDLSLIHSGLALLRRQFAAASQAIPKDARDRLGSLWKELDATNEAARREENDDKVRKARRLADEINELQSKFDGYELLVANALWGEKTYPLNQAYLDTIYKYYGASLFPVDFRNDSAGARQRINVWVERQTRARIKELISPGVLTSDTRLASVNAIYFKGQWTTPFEVSETKERLFTLADGSTVQTPTMYHSFKKLARYAAFNKDGTFFKTPRYGQDTPENRDSLYPGDSGLEMVELPYRGNELSMVVIVPRSADGLPALEKLLNGQTLLSCVNKLQERPVRVYLPKFKMESSFNLEKTLESLGMKRAFRDPQSKDGAQFDGMSDTKDAVERLFISTVLHKALIEVNEKGTEAAAATAAVWWKSAAQRSPFTPIFRADKPFVFLIRDQKTGAILFLGRVMNPKTGG
jgi:serine protease inhibitor